MDAPEVATVLAWHDALNAGDSDRLVGLSSQAIEVGGPRGSGSGVAVLRDWLDRAAIRLEPGRVFHRAGTVVVEQTAAWLPKGTGPASDPQDVASVFVVHGGQVARVVRYPDLAAALGAAGLDGSDELRQS